MPSEEQVISEADVDNEPEDPVSTREAPSNQNTHTSTVAISTTQKQGSLPAQHVSFARFVTTNKCNANQTVSHIFC
jgi:hypothetical protein